MYINTDKFINCIEDKSELIENLFADFDCVQLAKIINDKSLDFIEDMGANMYFADRLAIVTSSFKVDELTDIADCILSVLNKEQRTELVNLIK